MRLLGCRPFNISKSLKVKQVFSFYQRIKTIKQHQENNTAGISVDESAYKMFLSGADPKEATNFSQDRTFNHRLKNKYATY